MHDKIYQKDSFIFEAGKKCQELTFIVNGKVDIIVEDKFGE